MIKGVERMQNCHEYKSDDKVEEKAIKVLCREVHSYLSSYSWCRKIREIKFAGGFSKVAVFFVRLDSIDYDNELWVIAGDLPTAHLVLDQIPDAKEALLSYVYHMRKWVEAVAGKGNIENCFPVMAEPTIENANLLSARLDFIEEYCEKGI